MYKFFSLLFAIFLVYTCSASQEIIFETTQPQTKDIAKASWSLPSFINQNSPDFKSQQNGRYYIYAKKSDQSRLLLGKLIIQPPDNDQKCRIFLLALNHHLPEQILSDMSVALSQEGAFLTYDSFGKVAKFLKFTEIYVDPSTFKKSNFRDLGWTTRTVAKLLGQRDFKIIELELPLVDRTPVELLALTVKNRMSHLRSKL